MFYKGYSHSSKKVICGIDEAGRGPVLGPLVVVGFCVEAVNVEVIKKLGVKDSKLLSKRQREEFYKDLIEFPHKIIIISPEEIDNRFDNNKNLNSLEVDAMESIIKHFKPEKTIIDSPYKDCDKLKVELNLGENDIVEHKADENYAVVSAASIIAKVTRDNEIKKLEKEYNVSMGSGYPSDPYTIAFLKKGKEYPFIRKSWETYKNILKEKQQKKLFDF